MLSIAEEEFIKDAKKFFEKQSPLIFIANAIGKPLDIVNRNLPEKIQAKIGSAIENSLKKCLEIALKSTKPNLDKKRNFVDSIKTSHRNRAVHAGLTAVTGGVGGFFGAVTLPVELPLTTTLIMRNISTTANSFGFDAHDPTTAMECLYVFSLGSRSKDDDQFDSAYYSSRLAMSSLIRKSAEFIAMNSSKVVLDNMKKGTAPALIRFIGVIAARFEVVVTEKLLAEIVPIVGAVGGAAINVAFTDYFGTAAQYHFGMLALEKKYGSDIIEQIYKKTSSTH